MNAQTQIESLERQIKELKANQSSCSHNWGEAIYNPEKFREGYGSKFMAQGSDVWTEYEGYRDAYKPRWKRTCKKCGFNQFTYKQETVQIIQKPAF